MMRERDHCTVSYKRKKISVTTDVPHALYITSLCGWSTCYYRATYSTCAFQSIPGLISFTGVNQETETAISHKIRSGQPDDST